jgi:hypothetical protein
MMAAVLSTTHVQWTCGACFLTLIFVSSAYIMNISSVAMQIDTFFNSLGKDIMHISIDPQTETAAEIGHPSVLTTLLHTGSPAPAQWAARPADTIQHTQTHTHAQTHTYQHA